ncbi:MAG: bifunctional lytic transglycosylase/C40 family peptidase [Chloroflexota bacterium]|nr:bifunctional lytic transglycosylase/C40 family peptidase [Chloroflexota bacterium]
MGEIDVLLSASGLGRQAARLASGLVLLGILAIAFAISSVSGFFAAAIPDTAVGSARLEDIPPDQLQSMQAAASSCGLPWQVLAGVAKVESNFGQNMATSTAGAIGYGQFLPSTWATYGNGGSPFDFHAALPAMAHYLCDHGGSSDLRTAVLSYNHSDSYADQVMAVAVRYGYLAPGAPTSQAVDVARSQLGRPYVWGGASPQTSFDCSGLMQWTYGQLGISLPRTAQQQYNATARVTPDQLRPGDLVFFSQTYSSSDFITHVGLYVGNGLMINAPTEGDVVRELPVFSGYWLTHYAGAGRVAGPP